MPPVAGDLTLRAPTAAYSSSAAIVAVAVVATVILATRALVVASLDRAVLPMRAATRGTTATRTGGVVRALGVVGVDRTRLM
jgi:hypothetical protein